MKISIKDTTDKGIKYCQNQCMNGGCTTCPLVNKVCISAPYGLFLLDDRKLDFGKFVKDFKFMIDEIYEEQKDGTEQSN